MDIVPAKQRSRQLRWLAIEILTTLPAHVQAILNQQNMTAGLLARQVVS